MSTCVIWMDTSFRWLSKLRAWLYRKYSFLFSRGYLFNTLDRFCLMIEFELWISYSKSTYTFSSSMTTCWTRSWIWSWGNSRAFSWLTRVIWFQWEVEEPSSMNKLLFYEQFAMIAEILPRWWFLFPLFVKLASICFRAEEVCWGSAPSLIGYCTVNSTEWAIRLRSLLTDGLCRSEISLVTLHFAYR